MTFLLLIELTQPKFKHMVRNKNDDFWELAIENWLINSGIRAKN